MKRGYFGIGIFHGKTEQNVGTLWRSAKAFGADFVFTIGRRYKSQSTDTTKAPRHVPLWHFKDWDDFFEHVPCNCPVVAIELNDDSIPLEKYVHRERCIYLLGSEDNGIPNEVLNRCVEIVQIPGTTCLNVSTAGSIVMYDRISKG